MNFLYSPQAVAALEAALSSDRLTRYLADASGDKQVALSLYVKNTQLSEAFYTPLQGLEVCLRNSISKFMSEAYGPDWFEDGVAPLQHPLPEMIGKAKSTLIESKKEISGGRVVAELNFGFWVTILGGRYENNLWRPTLRYAFPHTPKQQQRKEVHGALNAVRRLRNRVAHHEPILHRNLQSDHALILRLVSWICPYTADWVASHSRFPELYDALKRGAAE